MDFNTIAVSLALIFGFFMAWGTGANDVANAMGTAVGSKCLTIKQAIIIAVVFTFCGAYFAGGETTNTLTSSVFTSQIYNIPSETIVHGMISSLLGAGLWLALATYLSIPVSSAHAMVGGLIGFGLFQCGIDGIQWVTLNKIMLSWVVSPVLGGVLAFFIYKLVHRLGDYAKFLGVILTIASCYMAFAYGSNNIGNAIAPILVIAEHSHIDMNILSHSSVVFIGALGIVTGMATYGHKVIATIGSGITRLNKRSAFAATFATASTIMLASYFGIPISATHTLVGSVIGVGIANSLNSVNKHSIKVIIISWLITLPICAMLSVICYLLLNIVM